MTDIHVSKEICEVEKKKFKKHEGKNKGKRKE